MFDTLKSLKKHVDKEIPMSGSQIELSETLSGAPLDAFSSAATCHQVRR